MQELNQAVYYTTAQVTELVDLSDQNVRKYVRLLEDRKYEVAKDEHNRRLFSANDVLILRELITKAKKPGYTLESAADEIMTEISDILSSSEQKMTAANNDSNEVREMFSHVIERLDAIQDENKDLKDNIRNLVERLERYDKNDEQRYIEFAQKQLDDQYGESTETVDNHGETSDVNPGGNGENNASNNVAYNNDDFVNSVTSPNEADAEETRENEESEEAPSVSELNHGNNIDMSEVANKSDGSVNEQKEDMSDNLDNQQSSQEKSGFFGSLIKIFKK